MADTHPSGQAPVQVGGGVTGDRLGQQREARKRRKHGQRLRGQNAERMPSRWNSAVGTGFIPVRSGSSPVGLRSVK